MHLLALLVSLLGMVALTPPALRAQESAATASATAMADSTELVVLVHGMGRTALSMLPLELALERSGYRVLNFNYSSYGPSVAEIGADLERTLAEETRELNPARVHFVGHSLGNLVVRKMLASESAEIEAGRFVMLAPPNRGSRMAERLAPYVGWLLRPIVELENGDPLTADLPPPDDVEFAIVAGDDDGKVAVDETCLPGATAHVVVDSGHTFILMRPAVLDLVKTFLEDGSVSSKYQRAPACG